MPWQGHLYIGKRVATWDDVRSAFADLGENITINDEDDITDIEESLPIVEKIIKVGDISFPIHIGFMSESEGGIDFPVSGIGSDMKYTDALVGFAITERYGPAIMDFDPGYTHCGSMCGRPEPFEFEPSLLADILSQVREFWPSAKALIWTKFY